MSAIKAWAEDVQAARRGAKEAACLPTPVDRFNALRLLFGELGEAATGYADPGWAALTLVQVAVREYRAARSVRALEWEGAK